MKTEEIINSWQIAEFAAMLERHPNTVTQWFNELEKRRIHYNLRVNNEKIFTEHDLEIGKRIVALREAKWPLNGIYSYIESNFDTRPFPDDFNDGETGIDVNSAISRMRDEFSNLLKEAQESIRKEIKYEYEQHMKETLSHITAQMQQELRKQLPEPKSSEQIRAERMERTIATTRIRAKLEQEALELWEQKPDSERKIRTGLFSKSEDVVKMQRFINDYINKYLEARIEEHFKG